MTIPAVSGLSRTPYTPSFKGAVTIEREEWEKLPKKTQNDIKEDERIFDSIYYLRSAKDRIGFFFEEGNKKREEWLLQFITNKGAKAIHHPEITQQKDFTKIMGAPKADNKKLEAEKKDQDHKDFMESLSPKEVASLARILNHIAKNNIDVLEEV